MELETTGAPATPPAAPLPLGYGALPGGMHAPTADTLPKGMFAFSAVGGFGWRSGLVGEDHRFGRGIGDLAFAYAPIDALTIALAFDGRYDRHYGVSPSSDDNYVGDPRLLLRLAKATGTAKLGAQVSVWAPGKDAPSIAAEAISVEGRALASIKAGAGNVGFSAGFRFDNSAKSVDDPMLYRPHERVSLGVSQYHAVVGGAYASFPVGIGFVGGEASIDLFLGDDPPGPMLRGGVHAGVHLGKQLSLLVFGELVKVPSIAADKLENDNFPVIAYEPMITGGIGLQARFGGGKRTARLGDPHIVVNPKPQAVPVIVYAELTGAVTDDNGQPIVGATVTAKLKTHTATGVTGPKGDYTIGRVPIGKTVDGATTLDDTAAEVSVSVTNKKPASTTVTLAAGNNPITRLELQPLLPPGQLRANVSAAVSGKPIAGATVTIEPGGITATSGADGTLSVDLPPGTYKATATAVGHKPQTLDVTVDTHGVAIKNFELAK